MSSNVGILSEQQIAGAINGKPFREINRNLQTMLRMIFPDLSDDTSADHDGHRHQHFVPGSGK